jgi:hypothetical protein
MNISSSAPHVMGQPLLGLVSTECASLGPNVLPDSTTGLEAGAATLRQPRSASGGRHLGLDLGVREGEMSRYLCSSRSAPVPQIQSQAVPGFVRRPIFERSASESSACQLSRTFSLVWSHSRPVQCGQLSRRAASAWSGCWTRIVIGVPGRSFAASAVPATRPHCVHTRSPRT